MDPKDKQSKTTNEKPVAIPLDFEDAVEALLNTPPKAEKSAKQSKPDKNKETSKS